MSGKESQSKKNHSLNTSRDKLQHSQKVHFNDKRPEAVVQQKTQQMADQFTNGQRDPIQKKKNKTGLPDKLKSGIENLSGHSMDDVKVHYNSCKPTQLNAHAYAQGTNIHVASGQEKHLPHEAWHVAQQKQGRVKPTKQLKSGVAINDDKGLEKEADVMGAKAQRLKTESQKPIQKKTNGAVKDKDTLQLKPKKKKGASIGKTMRKSGAANVISNMFIQQHMGNYKTAMKIAQQRAGTIPGNCHIVSIGELSKLYKEINNRETSGYHAIVGNRVINPATGNNQFATTQAYTIFEFSYDKKNRVKKGKTIKKRFYYDAIPTAAGGFILHHFDGII